MEISKYYGLSPVFDEAMVDTLNQMKEELSRITNRPFKPFVAGEASGIVSVATNQELISNITDVFKGINHINNWLNNDANKFTSLIANIRRSQLYKPIDVFV